MKDSKSGCITKVPRRRQLAYGGARNLNRAWRRLRLTEVSRSRHVGFRISKASCVGGTALLHFVGTWIHMALYERFNMIPLWWSQLRHGAFVACRSSWWSPEDLYSAGHSAPMTCGRVCLTMNLKRDGWVKAGDSKQYYCPTCARGPCTAP